MQVEFGHSKALSKLKRSKIGWFIIFLMLITPIDFINGETGLTRPKYRTYLNILRFYNHLINMNSGRQTYKIFEFDLQNISNENWSEEHEKILDDLNMHEGLLSGQIADLKAAEEN